MPGLLALSVQLGGWFGSPAFVKGGGRPDLQLLLLKLRCRLLSKDLCLESEIELRAGCSFQAVRLTREQRVVFLLAWNSEGRFRKAMSFVRKHPPPLRF